MGKASLSLILRASIPVALFLALAAAAVQAQLPTPNPLVAPLPPPSAPATLPAPVTTAIAPSLAAVPSPPQLSPTPAVQAFTCSCFGYGIGTRWTGSIAAANYFAARQAATSACLTYNERKEPAPPTQIQPSGGGFAPPLTLPQGFEAPDIAASPGLPGTLNFSTTEQLQACSNCTCG
ncbi:MAG TPA: hypothetical protein VFB15_09030 [Candidatus Binataceae bacterium]|jgi:hypothetical protein|nr:hypothetical protein [Candidatus Binataceae bacterium]